MSRAVHAGYSYAISYTHLCRLWGPPAASRLVEAQLKLLLLTHEQIVISDGAIFDNPAIWGLLGRPTGLREFFGVGSLSEGHLSPEGRSAIALLRSGYEGGSDVPTAEESVSKWMFSPETERVVGPSALQVPGLTEVGVEEGFQRLRMALVTEGRELGLQEYARLMEYRVLGGDFGWIDRVLEAVSAAHPLPKLPSRRSDFSRLVVRECRRIREEGLGVRSPRGLVRLEADCLNPKKDVTIGYIRHRYPEVYSDLFGLWNELRQQASLSGVPGAWNSMHHSGLSIPKGVAEKIASAAESAMRGIGSGRAPRTLLLDGLSFDQVAEVRERIGSKLRGLSERQSFLESAISLEEKRLAAADLNSFLMFDWQPAIENAIADIGNGFDRRLNLRGSDLLIEMSRDGVSIKGILNAAGRLVRPSPNSLTTAATSAVAIAGGEAEAAVIFGAVSCLIQLATVRSELVNDYQSVWGAVAKRVVPHDDLS